MHRSPSSSCIESSAADPHRFREERPTRHSDLDDIPCGRVLARREVLTLLGASAGTAALALYLPWSPARRGGWRRFGAATAAAAEPCVVRPELTEGPYFVDERLNRSDIRSDPSDGSVRDGVGVTFAFVVQYLDGSTCVPLEDALVDLWHCDAAGIYSDVQDPGFDTIGQMFLHGYQLTDSAGLASFITIYPGWYQGRTVHRGRLGVSLASVEEAVSNLVAQLPE